MTNRHKPLDPHILDRIRSEHLRVNDLRAEGITTYMAHRYIDAATTASIPHTGYEVALPAGDIVCAIPTRIEVGVATFSHGFYLHDRSLTRYPARCARYLATDIHGVMHVSKISGWSLIDTGSTAPSFSDPATHVRAQKIWNQWGDWISKTWPGPTDVFILDRRDTNVCPPLGHRRGGNQSVLYMHYNDLAQAASLKSCPRIHFR